MFRTYGSLSFFFFFHGLKPVAIILAEATPLKILKDKFYNTLLFSRAIGPTNIVAPDFNPGGNERLKS